MTERDLVAQRFSYQLRKRREARGMSFEDLSDLCGLTPALIQQLEAGQADPTLGNIMALAHAFECEARDLVVAGDDVRADDVLPMPVATEEDIARYGQS